ncbi:hypothetical protein C0J52_01382 [Blattella germanica]|nr:hypothetical protein C0J52_01382 [Blattella germanica]
MDFEHSGHPEDVDKEKWQIYQPMVLITKLLELNLKKGCIVFFVYLKIDSLRKGRAVNESDFAVTNSDLFQYNVDLKMNIINLYITNNEDTRMEMPGVLLIFVVK